MAFIKNHLPGIGSVVVLGLFVLLILTGYQKTLDRHLDVPSLSTYGDQIPRIVAAYHSLPDTPGITEMLVDLLTPKYSPVKRVAFTVLLSFTPPEKRLAAYLHDTHFTQNARRYFDTPLHALNAGEILILCDIALGRPVSLRVPDRAVDRRDNLLSKLHKRGALTDRQYQTERDHALSFAPDPKPIY